MVVHQSAIVLFRIFEPFTLLLSCRGPIDKAEGGRSKLARVVTAAVPPQQAAHESRRGATAAEAVDLSDDDDDVVIIEENMQPEPHAPAAAKQQGGSEGLTVCIMSAMYHALCIIS